MKRAEAVMRRRIAAVVICGIMGWLGGGPAAADPVVTLDQGWDAATAHRYHFTPQGTRIMPAAWLAVLEEGVFDLKPLMRPERMRELGFIVDDVPVSELNPYGWPIGITATGLEVDGVAMAGFTCAACHTGELLVGATRLRIEGGQAYHDAGAFQQAMARAVVSTWFLPWKYDRFRRRAVALGYPEARIDADFARTGRLTTEALVTVLRGRSLYPTDEGPGRLDALQRIANTLFADDLREPRNNRPGEAPVSFPPVWDIWRFDWVQYNASVRQPMVRNVGEALGVRALTNFVDPVRGTPVDEPQRWWTSIRILDIDWIERTLQTLRPPAWPEDLLGPIDHALAATGRELFGRHCAGCHGIRLVAGGEPDPEWQLAVLPLAKIGTDPSAAESFARNIYDASKLGLGAIDGATGLRVVAEKVKETAYDALGLDGAARRELDGFGRANLVVAACGYKARPLVGVWSTPPFLHNGSVPTIDDLLSEERPTTFPWGSRAFDPERLGLVPVAGPTGKTFDTRLPGNANGGHWFTDDATRPGRIGPRLALAERRALIEYLKAATYEDYPVTAATGRPALPCADDPGWARRAAAG
jgi:hypothetical protein